MQQGDAEAVAGLCSLPTPLVTHIMTLCDARSACSLATTCTSMRGALDDSVWTAQCARTPFYTAVQGVPNHTACVLAHWWKGWPLGWWRCTSQLPGGHVLCVHLQLDGDAKATLVLGFWGALSPGLGELSIRRLHLGSLDTVVAADPADEDKLAQVKAVVQLVGPSVLHLRASVMDGFIGWMLGKSKLDNAYERIPGAFVLGSSLSLPTNPEPPGCLEGIHSSYYGSHGIEYILLRFLDRQQGVGGSSALPAQLASGTGRLLTGLKLKGDPNVPSGELTFVADLDVVEQPREGRGAVQPWDSYNEDGVPDPNATVDGRPVVSFIGRHGVVDLRLEERLQHVAGIYPRCWGQINAVPGVWGPQWVRACVIAYRPGAVQAHRDDNQAEEVPVAFTLLWNDDHDRAWRHAMDFTMVARAL